MLYDDGIRLYVYSNRKNLLLLFLCFSLEKIGGAKGKQGKCSSKYYHPLGNYFASVTKPFDLRAVSLFYA